MVISRLKKDAGCEIVVKSSCLSYFVELSPAGNPEILSRCLKYPQEFHTRRTLERPKINLEGPSCFSAYCMLDVKIFNLVV